MRPTTPPFRGTRPAATAGLVLAVALTGACSSSSNSSAPAQSSSASASAPVTAPVTAPVPAPAATATSSAAAGSSTPTAPATSAAPPGAGTTAGTVFRKAAEASRASSARISITQSTVPVSGKATKSTETGVLDFRTSTGTLTLTPAGATEAITVILLGKTTYTRIPGDGTGGRSWVRTATPAGVSADPSASLAYLDAAVSNVRKVGTVTIGGTPATEYTATIDPVKALGPNASAASSAALRNAGITSATVEVYLDDRGRFRRQSTRLVARSYPSLSGGRAGPATLLIVQDLTDYGIAVHVTAPPASQVQTVGR